MEILVGGLEHEWIIFPSIGNFIIPTDKLIFFRGVGIPPTRFLLVNSHMSWTIFYLNPSCENHVVGKFTKRNQPHFPPSRWNKVESEGYTTNQKNIKIHWVFLGYDGYLLGQSWMGTLFQHSLLV